MNTAAQEEREITRERCHWRDIVGGGTQARREGNAADKKSFQRDSVVDTLPSLTPPPRILVQNRQVIWVIETPTCRAYLHCKFVETDSVNSRHLSGASLHAVAHADLRHEPGDLPKPHVSPLAHLACGPRKEKTSQGQKDRGSRIVHLASWIRNRRDN